MKFDRKYVNLIREIAASQFAVKDQNTVLGALWSILNPILMVAVLFLWFGQNAGREVEHYALYLLVGMVHYTHFATSTSAAMLSLTSMSHLTRNTILPKEALVIGSVLATSVPLVVSMALALFLAPVSGIRFTAAVLLLPLVLLVQLLFVLWVSFCLAALAVFLRDLNHLYQVFLRLMFFVTPVFYTASFLGDSMAGRLMPLNPLAQLIGFSRAALIEGRVVSLEIFAALTLFNAAAVVAAFIWFKRREPFFAEYA